MYRGLYGPRSIHTSENIDNDTDPDIILPKIKRLADNTKDDEGVLILTDIYGATPCNIAKKLCCRENIRLVSGLNLPMLLRVMNYAHLALPHLAEKAVSGGKAGIL